MEVAEAAKAATMENLLIATTVTWKITGQVIAQNPKAITSTGTKISIMATAGEVTITANSLIAIIAMSMATGPRVA